MTNEELDAIEQRANRATPGPWVWFMENSSTSGPIEPYTGFFGGPYTRSDNSQFADLRSGNKTVLPADQSPALPKDEDADFIVHSRTDIPKLVAEVRRLRSLVSEPK